MPRKARGFPQRERQSRSDDRCSPKLGSEWWLYLLDIRVAPKYQVFGTFRPDIQYVDRRAAYIVIIDDGQVALVKGREKYFLPGGGTLPEENARETIARELHEELATRVQITRELGTAIQYFYSVDDSCHYRMAAVFFAGTFLTQPCATGEHELEWVSIPESHGVCFHACHSWAILQNTEP